ncbi:zinc-binding dehydrogenase [Streptomyces roseolus]|uniref:zinc-binding dehydrogenase n=1 Tax=Streptomyces roseolus TaxID=67358 RepID=UPI0033EE8C7F
MGERRPADEGGEAAGEGGAGETAEGAGLLDRPGAGRVGVRPGLARLGDALRPGGAAVLYGRPDPRPVELSRNWPQTTHAYANGAPARTEEGPRRAAGFIGSGPRDGSLAPVIAGTFDGLERIADAHRLMESNTRTGKIVARVEH